METTNVPLLGNFSVADMVELTAVEIDSSGVGSSWLPAVTDGHEYWGQGPQKVSIKLSQPTDPKFIPFNPRTDLNPDGTCAFTFYPKGNIVATNANIIAIHKRIYDLDVNAQPSCSVTTESFLNNYNPTMQIVFDYFNNGFRTETIRTRNSAPLSDSEPSPDTLFISKVPSDITAGGTKRSSTLATFKFDEPVKEPNPDWPPLLPQELIMINPDPLYGIGCAGMYDFAFQVDVKKWVPVPVNFITDGVCPVDPTTDQVIINISAINPSGVICPHDNNIIVVRKSSDPMQVAAGYFEITPQEISADLFVSCKFSTMDVPPFKIINNFLSDGVIKQNEVIIGDYTGSFPFLINPIYKTDGAGGYELFFDFKGAGYSIGLRIKGNINGIIDKLYYSIPLPVMGNEAMRREWVATELGLYPMSNGLKMGSQLSINRRELEGLRPAMESGFNDRFNLSGSDIYFQYSYLFGCDAGPYYVAGAAYTEDVDGNYGPPQIIFVLRDGKGWYTCDLSEQLKTGETVDGVPIYDSVDYFSFADGIMFIGSDRFDENDLPLPIKYRAIQAALPRVQFKKLTLDYRAVGITFIPCQTRYLGKGGIFSKV